MGADQRQHHVCLSGQGLQDRTRHGVADVGHVQHPYAPYGDELHRTGVGIPSEVERQALARGKGADRHAAHELTRPGGTMIVCNAAGPGFANLRFRDNLVVEV